MWSRREPRRKGARSRGSALSPSRSKRSYRLIYGASARPASFAAKPPERASRLKKINRVDADAAKNDSPPGKHREAVTLHVVQERLHHDPAKYKREYEPDRDSSDISAGQFMPALERLIGEGADHGRHCQP